MGLLQISCPIRPRLLLQKLISLSLGWMPPGCFRILKVCTWRFARHIWHTTYGELSQQTGCRLDKVRGLSVCYFIHLRWGPRRQGGLRWLQRGVDRSPSPGAAVCLEIYRNPPPLTFSWRCAWTRGRLVFTLPYSCIVLRFCSPSTVPSFIFGSYVVVYVYIVQELAAEHASKRNSKLNIL